MIDKEKFGQALLLLRKQKNMSQKELASQLNVTPAAVSKWEHGQNYPDITMISSIAEFFEVSCDDLLQPEKILNPESDTKTLYETSSSQLIDDSLILEQDNCSVELTQSVTMSKRFFLKKWSPVILVLALLLIVSSASIYSLLVKDNTSTFEIISTRSTQTLLGESIYEVAVFCKEEPMSEEVTEYCMELRDAYEEGNFGATSFSTMKVLFYTNSEAVSSFEERSAFLVTHLYFESH